MKIYYIICITYAIAANLILFFAMSYQLVTGEGLVLEFNQFHELWFEWSIGVIALPGLFFLLYKTIKGDA